MAAFNGTIQIVNNPVAGWETYSKTFEPSVDEKTPGYFNLKFSQRSEGGYHRASFSLRGPYEFMAAFMEDGLGREIRIIDNDGSVLWEGFIHDMELDVGSAVYRVDLTDMANAVWVRYRVRGSSTTERSVVQTNAASISKFGRKEFILSGGELESTDIANDIALQYLNLHEWPQPAPVRIDPDKELSEYPNLNIGGHGWFDTLNWCTYNQTASTDSQGAGLQITDVIADTDVGQFVAVTDIKTNAVQVSKEYDADRRGGDIVKDIARIGDASANRYTVYMTNGRKLIYEQAAPPSDP